MTATSGARTALYDALVRPTHVALVGASDTAGKTTARPLEFLKRSGWRGAVYPVNPVRATVGGHRSWPSVQELPHRPDHVFVMTSADAAVTAVEQSVACGAPVVTVMSDGFVDTDPVGARNDDSSCGTSSPARDTRLLEPASGRRDDRRRPDAHGQRRVSDQDLRAGEVFVASQSGSAIGALA